MATPRKPARRKTAAKPRKKAPAKKTRPNAGRMYGVRSLPGPGLRAETVSVNDEVVYVTALRRAHGGTPSKYIRDVFPVLRSGAGALRDKVVSSGEHEAVDIRMEIPRDGDWVTNRVHHGKYTRSNGAKKRPAARRNGSLPQYPFLVVDKLTGRVHAGADYREDAEEMRRDLPTPAAQLQVLTRGGVRRKFGRISWTTVSARSRGSESRWV